MPQYLAALLAFAAVVVGIFGDTWDEATSRTTVIGWITIGVAAASMIVSIVATRHDRIKLDWQASQREKVQSAAKMDLRTCVGSLLGPFWLLYENIAFTMRDKADMNLDHDGFYNDAEYMKGKLLDPVFMEQWKEFDLRKHPQYPSIYPTYQWWEYFSMQAKEADERFDSIVAKYSAYLDANELLLIRELQTCRFFSMNLKRLKVLVDVNERMPKYVVAFAFRGGPDEGQEYREFVENVTKLTAAVSPLKR